MVRSFRFVEHLDVLERVATGFGEGGLDPPFDAFAFEQMEEALGTGNVLALAASAHAAQDAVIGDEALPGCPGPSAISTKCTTNACQVNSALAHDL